MKALKKRGENLGCTGQDFFNAIVQGSHFWGDPGSSEFVLERHKSLSLSQDIIECIASDAYGGVEMLRYLCQKHKDISFSQDRLAAAAKKEVHGMDLVDIVLGYDKTLKISQLVIQAAASNPLGHKVFFVLMYHKKGLEITWESLKDVRWFSHFAVTAKIVRVLIDHEYCGFKFPSEKPPVMESFFLWKII